jgi:hypothetical protein
MKNLALVLAIGVTAASSTNSANALPNGYPPYVDVNTYYADLGQATYGAPILVLSEAVFNDQVIVGDDSNGGWVERTTFADVLTQIPVINPSTGDDYITSGQYYQLGYEDAGLPIILTPESSPNLATQPPAPTPPKKTPQQIAQWAADAAINFGLAAAVNSYAPEFCLGWGNPIAILACDASAYLAAAQLQAVGNGFIQDIKDPSDPNYTQIISLELEPVLSALDFPNMTPTETDTWDDFVQNLEALSVLPDAIATSFSRAEGAFEAGAPEFWVDLQLEAMNAYDQLAEVDIGNIQGDADSLGLNTSVATVPEPSTLTLFCTATIPGLLLLKRRRRLERTSGVSTRADNLKYFKLIKISASSGQR